MSLSRLTAAWLVTVSLVSTLAGEPRILKVLPHLMDEQGRIAIFPGLFERDAYQRELRQGKIPASGVRFDIQWQAGPHDKDRLKLRVTARTAKKDAFHPVVIEANTQGNRRLGGWSSVVLDGPRYQDSGEVLAWRVALLDGDQEIAAQESFLWSAPGTPPGDRTATGGTTAATAKP